MHRNLLLLAATTLLTLAACGDETGFGIGTDKIEADPLYFADQIFDCDDSTATPSCPPYSCAVDDSGRVSDCKQGCAFENDSTAFEFVGTSGRDLCVPPVCTITAENVPPTCDPGCAEDDVTLYLFAWNCR